MVFSDRFIYTENVGPSAQNLVVLQDRCSLMAVVSQDRFHCRGNSVSVKGRTGVIKSIPWCVQQSNTGFITWQKHIKNTDHIGWTGWIKCSGMLILACLGANLFQSVLYTIDAIGETETALSALKWTKMKTALLCLCIYVHHIHITCNYLLSWLSVIGFLSTVGSWVNGLSQL